MKKLIATLSIVLIILNIYAPSSRATGPTQNALDSFLTEGTAGLPQKEGDAISVIQKSLDAGSSNNKASILTVLLNLLSMLPKIVSMIMSNIALHGKVNYLSSDYKEYSLFTVQDLLLGKYYLFDIDIFNTSTTGEPNSSTINSIKENVAIWYVSLRNVSLVGSALIIIYVAIRLALATLSDGPADTAKYKKMLMSWVVGFILIYVLQYIVIGLLYISDIFTKFIYGAIEKGSSESTMEASILVDRIHGIMGGRGANKLPDVILYFGLVYYELKFFLMYLKRSFETFFLMIISPLVCMLYPIDNIGDGRSQSFKAWFQKLMGNILLRPIHLFIYVIFIFTASELAKAQPIIAILFLAAMSNGEKIIKMVLGLGGPNIKDQKVPKLRMPRMRRH